MNITGPVGTGGINRSADVKLVQQLLSQAGMNPGPLDGISGPKTTGAITQFQKGFLARPDGRVDPHGQTIKKLQAVKPGAPKPAVPLPGAEADKKFRASVEQAAKREGVPPSVVTEFLAFWESSQFPALKTWLSSLDTAENVTKVAQFFFFLRKFGMSLADASKVMLVVAGLRAPQVIPFIDSVVRNGGRVSGALKKAGGVRSALSLIVATIEIYNLTSKGEWSQAVATIYKTLIGLAVPWAAGIDAIQSLFPEVSPASGRAFKVLRACDPIGLGGVGVDALVTMVQSMVDFALGRDFNEQRLSQLVQRMKTGPTALFAEIGEEAGDALFEISQMDAEDWRLVGRYTVSEFSNWVKGIGK